MASTISVLRCFILPRFYVRYSDIFQPLRDSQCGGLAGVYVNYILANGSHGPGFYVVEGEGQLAAGKAYLRLPAKVAGESRAIGITFAEDATGIEGISGDSKTTTDEWFDQPSATA